MWNKKTRVSYIERLCKKYIIYIINKYLYIIYIHFYIIFLQKTYEW